MELREVLRHVSQVALRYLPNCDRDAKPNCGRDGYGNGNGDPNADWDSYLHSYPTAPPYLLPQP